MRKLTKILTILLAMTMLFGMVSVFAFADSEEEANQLVPKNAVVTGYEDFENIQTGSFGLKGTTTLKTKSNAPFSGATTTVKALIGQQTNASGDSNKYLHITYDIKEDHSQYTKQAYVDIHNGDMGSAFSQNSHYSTENYDYWLYDFDFCAMEYTYELNGSKTHGTTVPEGATNVKLAYGENFKFNTSVRSTGGSVAYTQNVTGYFVYDKDTNNWYVSTSTKYDPKGQNIKLSNNLGEWNHMTFIVKVDRNNVANSKKYIYVNDQYLGENTFGNGATFAHADCIRFWFNTAGSKNSYHTLSFDNFSFYYYAKNYSSGDDVYGVDDFFADPNYKTNSIAKVQDLVYNEDYVYIGTENLAAATIDYEDGTSKTISSLSRVLKSIENKAVVKLNVSLLDFTPNSLIEELTFKAMNDEVAVSLSPEALENYKLYHNGDTYTIKLRAAEDGIKLRWLKSEGSTEFFFENYLLPFTDPNFSKFYSYNTIDMAKGTITNIVSWKIVLPGTEYDGKTLSAMSVSEINALKELHGVDTIELVPAYNTFNVAFMVTTVDGEGNVLLYAPGNNFEVFTAISNINNILATAPSGATLTFFGDATVPVIIPAELGDFTIGAGKTLNVDLNGLTLSHNSATLGKAYGPALFAPKEGSTFNIYNGTIFQAKANKDQAHSFGNAAILNIATGINEVTVNIGKDAEGNSKPLNFNGGSFVYVHGVTTPNTEAYPKNIDLHDSKKIKINIEGGNFYLGIKPAYAVFAISAPDVEISINKACFYVGATLGTNQTQPSAMFIEYPDANAAYYYTAGFKINATNSKFVCRNANNTSNYVLFYRSTETTQAYFENCEIIGDTFYEKNNYAKITLGKGNVVAGDMADYIKDGRVKFADNVNYAVNLGNAEYMLTVKVSYPENFKHGVINDKSPVLPSDAYIITNDIEKSDVISLSTFEGENENANIGKIIWLNTDKETAYLTEYVYVGNTLTNVPSASSFGKYDPDNGWYQLVYGNAWENVSDGADKASFVVVTGENKFAPVYEKPVMDLDVKVNVEFFTNIAFNVYLEKFDDASGITFDGFFIGEDSLVYGEKEEMICLKQFLADDEFTSDDITIKFTVLYNGTPYTFEKTVKFDLMKYAEAITYEFECGSPEATLALALMEYKRELYVTAAGDNVDEAILSDIDMLLLGHGKNCECIKNLNGFSADNFTEAEKEITADDYASLADYVAGFDYIVSTKNESLDIDHLAFVLYTKDAAGVTGISATLSANPETTVNFVKVSDNEYRISGITVADIDSIITITITTDAGSVVGSYCLAEHIELNSDAILPKALYVISTLTSDEE